MLFRSYNATALTSAQNGYTYTIASSGSTNWTLIGAANNNVGTTFTKSGGTGAGSGTATINQDGAWFSQLRIGSTSWANAPFYVDGSGNVLIDNSNDTTKTATFKLNSNGITTIINNTYQDPLANYCGVTIINNSSTSERTVISQKTLYMYNASNVPTVSLRDDSSSGVLSLFRSSGSTAIILDANAITGAGEVIVSDGSSTQVLLSSQSGISVGGSNIVDTSRNATFNSVKIGSTTRLTSAGEAELNSYCKVGKIGRAHV